MTVGEVSHMASFNAQCFPNSLALVVKGHTGEEKLTIGCLESLQRLHVRTIPLNGQQPRRIAHLPNSKLIAVCTMDSRVSSINENSVSFFDASTFSLLASMKLELMEEVLSATCVNFEGDDTEYVYISFAL